MFTTIIAGIIVAAFLTMLIFKLFSELAKDYAAAKTKDYSRLIATGVSILFATGLCWSINHLTNPIHRPHEMLLKCTAFREDTATAADCVKP